MTWRPNPDTFMVSPWARPPEPAKPWRPDFADDEELKRAFGIAWAKEPEGFKAALSIFDNDTSKSLWASTNWKNDPLVVATKDAYEKEAKALAKPLTKEELLNKVLGLVDEKDIHGRPLVEAKERINALKLYSEISGFTGKIDINASTNTTNNVNNLMKIVLVKPENKDQKTIDHQASNSKSEMSNDVEPLLKLKLVGGGSK